MKASHFCKKDMDVNADALIDVLIEACEADEEFLRESLKDDGYDLDELRRSGEKFVADLIARQKRRIKACRPYNERR